MTSSSVQRARGMIRDGGHRSTVDGRSADPAQWATVMSRARCADGRLDPDLWFPVSAEPAEARREAAAAIAVCFGCPVRPQCLELSLRDWRLGQHGIWGGLVAADRALLRRTAIP